MGQTFYQLSLIVTGIINVLMGIYLLRGNHRFTKYPVYRMARIATIIWVISFGIGYLLHALFLWRFTWPTAASALSVTYFHLAAICFSWGYTGLLNPHYLTKRIKVFDIFYYIVGLICYWTVALLWKRAPLYTILSFCIFFAYAVRAAFIFYRTYNLVSLRLLKMSMGNMLSFVHWMQMCTDLIVLFGIGSVVITAIFPTETWPYVLLLVAGVGMFAYMVYSIEKYGEVIDEAAKATLHKY